MNGKKSQKRFRDRVTAVLAAAGVIAMTSGLVVMAASSPAQANDNPGNNGTVKVAATGDIDTIPDNEPHLPCTFTVQWYNFGAPAVGEDPFVGIVEFELQEPTVTGRTLTVVSGDTTKLIQQDTPGGAGDDFDGEEAYTLSFTGDPQPEQGYHVKITVTTPDSKGSDIKHKVFWVGPCETPRGIVTAGTSSFTNADCAGPTAGISVPADTSDITYSYNPTLVAPGQTVVVTATALNGKTFANGQTTQTTSHTYPSFNPATCATAVSPGVQQSQACGVQGTYTIPNTTGVDYYNGNTLLAPNTYSGPAAFTITAMAESTYTLTNPTFSYQLNLPAANTNCGGGGSSTIDSTAVIPDVDQAGPCEVEGSYTIPNTTGVDYFLDGVAIPAGTYAGPDSGTITAAAESGYDLTNDGFSYGLYVAAAEDCPVVVPAVDVCPNLTGNQSEIPVNRVKNGAGDCVIPAEVAGTETPSPKPDKTPVVKGVEAVPTAVAAGIGGNGPTVTGVLPIDLLAQMLVGGGLVLLMAAGWLQIGRRTHGVHQA